VGHPPARWIAASFAPDAAGRPLTPRSPTSTRRTGRATRPRAAICRRARVAIRASVVRLREATTTSGS
jgi:hypothetical protein